MNIVLSESNFNIDNIYFTEPIVNTIMDNSMFIKIIYSNKLITLNGLYLTMDIRVDHSELYFKKIKYTYDLKNSHNHSIINNLYSIESSILDKHTSSNLKTKKYILHDTLKTGMIKIFPNQPNIHNNLFNTPLSTTNNSHNQSNNHKHPSEFILKISGIWENDTEYGITYKLSTS
jgi:hypothetical protein